MKRGMHQPSFFWLNESNKNGPDLTQAPTSSSASTPLLQSPLALYTGQGPPPPCHPNLMRCWSERTEARPVLWHVLTLMGTIQYCSQSVLLLAGYRPDEWVGRLMSEFVHVDDLAVFTSDICCAFTSGRLTITRFRLLTRSGGVLPLHVVGRIRVDSNGQPSFIGVGGDQGEDIEEHIAMLDAFLHLKRENERLWAHVQRLEELHHQLTSAASAMTVATKAAAAATNAANAAIAVSAASQPRRAHTASVALSSFPLICVDCGTTTSPEWRKGPNGPKTLCNACGLRWAKKRKDMDGH